MIKEVFIILQLYCGGDGDTNDVNNGRDIQELIDAMERDAHEKMMENITVTKNLQNHQKRKKIKKSPIKIHFHGVIMKIFHCGD